MSASKTIAHFSSFKQQSRNKRTNQLISNGITLIEQQSSITSLYHNHPLRKPNGLMKALIISSNEIIFGQWLKDHEFIDLEEENSFIDLMGGDILTDGSVSFIVSSIDMSGNTSFNISDSSISFVVSSIDDMSGNTSFDIFDNSLSSQDMSLNITDSSVSFNVSSIQDVSISTISDYSYQSSWSLMEWPSLSLSSSQNNYNFNTDEWIEMEWRDNNIGYGFSIMFFFIFAFILENSEWLMDLLHIFCQNYSPFL
ncbi:hypothetical protein CYY_009849 [Polysphondylium violaceum]|uniref:Uncharacterized protein n=1 Tax=Polysphondylium violaceum TaxID=133409 RepID=A0A8J4PKS7_9MYCE|nr:hypothetical protein CYY_009849 [Polysphondylium violaceum]